MSKYQVLPILLVVLAMTGMMVVFLSDSAKPPAIIHLLLVSGAATIGNSVAVEIGARRRPRKHSLPGYALPTAGVIGGLVACAQLAIHLANHLQEIPVAWFLHVPGITALLGLLGFLHATARA